MMENEKDLVLGKIQLFENNFEYSLKETAIILAAGHGKRIKSNTSKMLHKIWEKPTVERVYDACKEGLNGMNIVVVVGIKASDVIDVISNRANTTFAYQEQQNGTGHAVQVALDTIEENKYDGIVYVLPGDMGLINKETMAEFKIDFANSGADMVVLTGLYEGEPELNSYGRIVRVKALDSEGNPSGKDEGKVIEIIEHKDILRLNETEPYKLHFNGRVYSYSRKELIENNEFNSGVYAFKYNHLVKLIKQVNSNNAQNEIYITDLISIFNQNALTVGAVCPQQQYVLMGFNNKSVLKQMEQIARENIYEKIKDIIEIEDPEDFFIHENVVKDIIELDSNGQPLEIKIGKGVYIGAGVKINYNLTLKKNAFINGNVIFGKNVTIWENAMLSTFPNQKLILGNNVEILWGDIVKGDIQVGDNARIESSVNVTGSDEHPVRIGKNVVIKGTSYIFGSTIEDDIFVEHSILIKKKVERNKRKNGDVQQVKFFLPPPEGMDSISDI
ncbi:MAG: NTP transferase domain-containing protein [Bacteroidetes bacterium]|nr:NTP transferase domain-containing protein [Bacteroidota bacterium]